MNRIQRTTYLLFVVLISFLAMPTISYGARPEVDSHLFGKWTSQQYPGLSITLNADYSYESTPFKLDNHDFGLNQGYWETQGTILCLHTNDPKNGRSDIFAIFTLSSDKNQLSLMLNGWDENIFKFTRS